MYLHAADIMLPDFTSVDGTKWATLACDQHTSEPEYWENAERLCSGAPSTLGLMLPEVWLAEGDVRASAIHKTMRDYVAAGLFRTYPNSAVYLERKLSGGGVRRGIVACIDLEDYDYSVGSVSPIRATEKTVVERIPPRLAVRRGAMLEMPHVMLLLDDPSLTVFDGLEREGREIYSFSLMAGGGSVRGRLIGEDALSRVNGAIDALVAARGVKHPIALAVGDGNHSLATAKAAYEEIKRTLSPEAAEVHPARYALCETVCLHEKSLVFEPIYRLVMTENPDALISAFDAHASSLAGSESEQVFTVVAGGVNRVIRVVHPEKKLSVATLQTFLDDYATVHPDTVTDYIHGEDALVRLASEPGCIGFLFDGMGKSELFSAVEADGTLPRKTFSMGHAADKRYYIECRRISV